MEEGEGEVEYSDLVQDEKDADVLQNRVKEYQVRDILFTSRFQSKRVAEKTCAD